MYKSLYGYMFLFLLGKFLEVKLLGIVNYYLCDLGKAAKTSLNQGFLSFFFFLIY